MFQRSNTINKYSYREYILRVVKNNSYLGISDFSGTHKWHSIMSIRNQSVQKIERNQKHLKGQRRARFSQRRTTTFVTEDDSLRLKQLQGKSV